MDTYVLIGGIGSGKSTVGRLLSEYGAARIDLDVVGKSILDLPEVDAELKEVFGDEICAADGTLDRRALARVAFATPESQQQLEAITHPALARLAQEELDARAEAGCAVAIVEASAFRGRDGVFDWLIDESRGIIAVIADEQIRFERAVAAGFAERDVRARMQRQATDDQRVAWADYIIENNGSLEDLQDATQALWEWIQER